MVNKALDRSGMWHLHESLKAGSLAQMGLCTLYSPPVISLVSYW